MTEEAKRIIEVMEMLSECRYTPCCKCKMLKFKGEKACAIEDVVYQSAIDMIESLSEQLEQAARERDAAVEDLSAHRPCDACGFYELQGNDCMRCRRYTERPMWKWRGVEVEGING